MKKLFVLSGGIGSEREVSLASGKNVIETLRSEGIECEEVIVEQDKKFHYEDKVMTEEEGVQFLYDQNALVFQLIHGMYGEDGELVKKLETKKIPCIGSISSVLSITYNKYLTEVVLREHGVMCTQSLLVKKLEDVTSAPRLTFPSIVKPNTEGSSVGLVKVETYLALKEQIPKSLATHTQLLVQKCIVGREFTCGVVEIGRKPLALLPTEIITNHGKLFDYEAKYTQGVCREVTPADVDDELRERIQAVAMRVHNLCGCKDISRTDMILDEEGALVVLEINTIPGMTKTSFIPAQMKASGYTLAQFIETMIEKYQ